MDADGINAGWAGYQADADRLAWKIVYGEHALQMRAVRHDSPYSAMWLFNAQTNTEHQISNWPFWRRVAW